MSRNLQKAFEIMLTQKLAIGESRHQGKIDGSAKSKIYSINTVESYKKSMKQFAKYCEEKGVNNPKKAKNLADEYIQSLKDKGASAWTQQSVKSAIHKTYGEVFIKTECDIKHRACIVRSRMDTAQARHFSETKNAELIQFCQHTGLRRSELEHLDSRVNRLEIRDGQWYITAVKGKGGKVRDVPVLDNYQPVIDKMNGSDGLVWGRVHSNANIHGYRADYANELYYRYERPIESLSRSEVYHCKGDMKGSAFDKKAMAEVSKALGHNRIDVIANNYLRSK